MTVSLDQASAAVVYNSETGVFFRINRGGRKKAGDVAGYCRADGYRLIFINGKWVYAHRLAWLLEKGVWPSNEIDHINGDRDDNRISNLREATRSENMRNIRGKKGWHYHSKHMCWQALIRVNKTRIYLGSFNSEEQAKIAYLAAANELHGHFAPKPVQPKQEAFL